MYVCKLYPSHAPGTHEVSLTLALTAVAQMPASQVPKDRHKTWLVSQRIHPALEAGTSCSEEANLGSGYHQRRDTTLAMHGAQKIIGTA